jgi:hypothetical protein
MSSPDPKRSRIILWFYFSSLAVVLCFVALGVYQRWDAAHGKTAEENRQAYIKLDGTFRDNHEAAQAAIRETLLQRVEASFGHAARLTYDQCQSNPPKLMANQKTCRELMARVDATIKREDAKGW